MVLSHGCSFKGVGRRLLEAVEGKARELRCCKLTLEVMDNNHRKTVLELLPDKDYKKLPLLVAHTHRH